MFRKRLTLKEHIETAKDLEAIDGHLHRIYERCARRYPESSKLMKMLTRARLGSKKGIFNRLHALLDDEYHDMVSDRKFRKIGDVYSHFPNRRRTP